jgi:hypothetical protein
MKPGTRAAVGALVAVLALDVIVIARSGDAITHACRRHPVITAAVIGSFVLHVADVLGPADPYRGLAAAAKRVTGTDRRANR